MLLVVWFPFLYIALSCIQVDVMPVLFITKFLPVAFVALGGKPSVVLPFI